MVRAWILLAALTAFSAGAQVRTSIRSPILGTWESETAGYARFEFGRYGDYEEVQEQFDRKSGRIVRRIEAEGRFLLNVRELTLRQKHRTITSYDSDGNVRKVQEFGRAERVVYLLLPKKEHMQVTDTDGTKRQFVRTRRVDD